MSLKNVTLNELNEMLNFHTRVNSNYCFKKQTKDILTKTL